MTLISHLIFGNSLEINGLGLDSLELYVEILCSGRMSLDEFKGHRQAQGEKGNKFKGDKQDPLLLKFAAFQKRNQNQYLNNHRNMPISKL